MTRHGLTHPRAGAIALRSTARAVLDTGNANFVTGFRAICRGGSDHVTIRMIEAAHGRPRYLAPASMLSGDFTSKSP